MEADDGGAAHASHDSFISLGDQVYLHEDATSGHVSVEGFTDMQLCLDHESSLTAESVFGAHAVFRLMPQQMYTMARQLRSFDAHPPDISPEQLKLRRTQMLEEARREKSLNESEVENTVGREVRYGKVLQLQHVVSGKLVAVSHLASMHNRDARQVQICESDVGEAAWFRIVPKLRVHTDGEKVRAGEPVIIENVTSGLKLHIGIMFGSAERGSEINASGDE